MEKTVRYLFVAFAQCEISFDCVCFVFFRPTGETNPVNALDALNLVRGRQWNNCYIFLYEMDEINRNSLGLFYTLLVLDKRLR